jgi:hypothetical protein
VPETTIHEDSDPELWKNEVGIAKHKLVTPPANDVVKPEQFRQRQFRILVLTTPDAGHDL